MNNNHQQLNQHSGPEQKKRPTFRLVAYFKPGSKHPMWRWNSEWLLNHYKSAHGYGQTATEYGAVKMKIEEVLYKTTRLIVFDNRPGKTEVLLEYVNGKLRVDNTKR